MNEMEQMNAIHNIFWKCNDSIPGTLGKKYFVVDYFRGLTRRLDIKARAEPSSARPQEAVRGECGDNRVVL